MLTSLHHEGDDGDMEEEIFLLRSEGDERASSQQDEVCGDGRTAG